MHRYVSDAVGVDQRRLRCRCPRLTRRIFHWGMVMSYTEVPGIRVPIRMWTDPSTVEDGAMQQLRNVSSLPWIKGLAVMPDVHYGKGATVGSVIAMEGAVCPA